MKKITVLSFSFISLCAAAQNVKLKTGQKINNATSMSINMDMGAAGQIKIESTTTSLISITGMDNNSYKADNTIMKLKMSEDAGFQNTSYDSQDKADTTSEMAKALNETLNRPAALFIDKTDGSVKEASPEKPKAEESGNPLGGLMGGSMSPSASAQSAFFVLPAGKKVGDKWSDSTTESSVTALRTYELQSLKNNIAVVAINAITKMNMQQEAQGMQVTIDMSGTSVSSINADISTGLVQKTTTKGTMTGTMEILGQSAPVTMTIDSDSVFQ